MSLSVKTQQNTNLQIAIRFKGVGILLDLGILDHSPLPSLTPSQIKTGVFDLQFYVCSKSCL